MLSIVWDSFTTLLILGEDVFWRFNFVDQFYSNYGTTTGDVFLFVWATGQFSLLAVVILWNTGLLGYVRDWANANL